MEKRIKNWSLKNTKNLFFHLKNYGGLCKVSAIKINLIWTPLPILSNESNSQLADLDLLKINYWCKIEQTVRPVSAQKYLIQIIVNDRLMCYMNEYNAFSNCQHDFKNNLEHPYGTQYFSFEDLSKAFHCNHYSTSLVKLKHNCFIIVGVLFLA